ncbi:hypothetical protein D3C85_1512540 [compost metagenome]
MLVQAKWLLRQLLKLRKKQICQKVFSLILLVGEQRLELVWLNIRWLKQLVLPVVFVQEEPCLILLHSALSLFRFLPKWVV